MRNQKTEPNNKKQKQNTNNTKENTTKQQTTKKYPKRKSDIQKRAKPAEYTVPLSSVRFWYLSLICWDLSWSRPLLPTRPEVFCSNFRSLATLEFDRYLYALVAAFRVLGPSSGWFLIAPASLSLAFSSRALAWSVLGDKGGEGKLPSCGAKRPRIVASD